MFCVWYLKFLQHGKQKPLFTTDTTTIIFLPKYRVLYHDRIVILYKHSTHQRTSISFHFPPRCTDSCNIASIIAIIRNFPCRRKGMARVLLMSEATFDYENGPCGGTSDTSELPILNATRPQMPTCPSCV